VCVCKCRRKAGREGEISSRDILCFLVMIMCVCACLSVCVCVCVCVWIPHFPAFK